MADPATPETIHALLERPFLDLVFEAQKIHRQHFRPSTIQASTLLSVKTGGCPEDCAYCAQAARYATGVERQGLLSLEEVTAKARAAREAGATRFCLSAAWRGPTERNLNRIVEMVAAVKALGLETCATLGMLKEGQAERLKEAGLDFYNHNLDTSSTYYQEIVSTRTYQDRLETLDRVQQAGIKVCCGGILGMGEDRHDRAGLIAQLANLDPQPESVPINNLVPVAGTPLEGAAPLDVFEFIRTIAAARISLPRSYVRLAAGRLEMSETEQALCFLAGANSIFCGERLLTTPNPDHGSDQRLLNRLGLSLESEAGDSCISAAPEDPAEG